ncbi:MAG: SDR family NAD(P)-dependent oxidoreductase [Bdellovibrionales bacterium]|jgi:NAD(P)-dependent dehydrogenase (short-subunit alcohol dehydrogenase family)
MNHHVLITGAGKRVGRVMALDLAKAGWDITIHYNTSKEEAETLAQEITALGRTVFLAQANLEKPDDIARLIPVKEAPPLTALIHNASLFIHDAEDPAGARHRAVNVDAPLALNDAFLAQLPQGCQGAIVQILDSTLIPPHMSAYARSRAAMAAMIPTLARRYAPHARINGLALGPTLKNERQSQAHFDALVAATPSHKPTEREALNRRLLALLQDEGINGTITGCDS